MTDDDGENDQCTKDNRSNNNVNLDLFDAVKQSSMKIKLLVDGQKEIMKQLQLLTEKLVGLTPQNGDGTISFKKQVNPEKLITHKEITKMFAKAKIEGVFKKKGNIPKYPPEMDLFPYPPKFKQPELHSFSKNMSACRHIIHFNNLAEGMTGIVKSDSLWIRLFISTLKRVAFD